MICLSVRDATALSNLTKELDSQKIKYTTFFEPDINEITSIAISPSEKANEITKGLQLANIKAGNKDKNT